SLRKRMSAENSLCVRGQPHPAEVRSGRLPVHRGAVDPRTGCKTASGRDHGRGEDWWGTPACFLLVLQADELVEADDEAVLRHHLGDRQHDAGHEGVAPGGIVTDAEGLARVAEGNLMVSDEARHSLAVDRDSFEVAAAGA